MISEKRRRRDKLLSDLGLGQKWRSFREYNCEQRVDIGGKVILK